jgi:hypothetical protein
VSSREEEKQQRTSATRTSANHNLIIFLEKINAQIMASFGLVLLVVLFRFGFFFSRVLFSLACSVAKTEGLLR